MSTEPHNPNASKDQRGPCWRLAGLLYLAVMLVCLAIGLWEDVLFPPHQGSRAAPLATLQTLAVGQVMFILLVYPLVLLHRARREKHYWTATVAESAVFMLIAAVFYIPAAYLADAVIGDVIRTAIYVAAIFPLAWSAGAYFRRHGAAWAVLGVLVLIAIALPAGYYIALEFFGAPAQQTISHLAPAIFAWQTAAARQLNILPQPLWALLIWPAAAIIFLAAESALSSRRQQAR